jgi:ribosomal-protein-alanine N-acetyltransferase
MIEVMTATQRALVTARLRLEPLHPRHAAALVALFDDPALSAYLAADFTQRDQAEAVVRQWLGYDGPAGLGHWAFCLGSTLIGVGHLTPSTQLPGGLPETGWYLATRYGRRGLATEAVGALLRHGLGELGLSSVWALIHQHNQPSLRLAQRLGFLQVGSAVHYGAPHHVHVALPENHHPDRGSPARLNGLCAGCFCLAAAARAGNGLLPRRGVSRDRWPDRGRRPGRIPRSLDEEQFPP